jgi:hypothetical protein
VSSLVGRKHSWNTILRTEQNLTLARRGEHLLSGAMCSKPCTVFHEIFHQLVPEVIFARCFFSSNFASLSFKPV